QVFVLLEIADMVFNQNELRPPVLQVKTTEDFKLMSFHVDGHELEFLRSECLREDVIKRAHGNFDRALRLRTRRHTIAIKRRERTGDMKAHALAGILR